MKNTLFKQKNVILITILNVAICILKTCIMCKVFISFICMLYKWYSCVTFICYKKEINNILDKILYRW
jgi:hypothetical protein